jgi:hypothetical protein
MMEESRVRMRTTMMQKRQVYLAPALSLLAKPLWQVVQTVRRNWVSTLPNVAIAPTFWWLNPETLETTAASSRRKKKKDLNDVELALKKEEMARKRKNLSEKRAQDEQVNTVSFLL